MTRRLFNRLLLLFLPALFVHSAWAYRNTYAVIIGVADYEVDNSSDLMFTTRDAQLFCNFLRSPAGGSVPAQNICIMKDASATKSNIMEKTRALFSKAEPEDRVIFFFSGHGCAGYLIPYDGDYYGNNFLSYDELKALFRCAKARTKLMFADACFAGDFKNTLTQRSTPNNNAASRNNSDIAIMLSCKDNEYSIEDGFLRQGIFSYYLVKGLNGAADRDGNSLITIQELFYYVHNNTLSFSQNVGRSQQPVLFGNFDLRLIVGYVKKDKSFKLMDEPSSSKQQILDKQ